MLHQRFTKKHGKHFSYVLLLGSLLLAIFFLVGGYYFATRIQSENLERQKSSLEAAIDKDITNCYALEGYYPPTLSYLEEHYGLQYNSKIFYVDYQPVAGNIRPDYTVILLKEAA